MNLIFISPNFPPNFYNFCLRLHRRGAKVFGLAETPYEQLRPELRESLTEYYRVGSLEDYDQLLRATGHFIHGHGRMNAIESHNEYWLETEARLREDFNIPGIRPGPLANLTLKSRMKDVFHQAGVAVATGAVVPDLEAALTLAALTDFPVVLKPDRGVGAAATYRIEDQAGLEAFFAHKPPVNYIMEEFVTGIIESFDGLTDQTGRIVFCASHVFKQGIMETVNENRDIFYYSLREPAPDLEAAGRRVVAAGNLSGKFFHIEFFRTQTGGLVGLEINARPPGGLTTDMFNYANDIDVYDLWAALMTGERVEVNCSRPYFCGYAGRKFELAYRRSHEEIMAAWGRAIVHHEEINSIFRGAIGDYGYLLRSPELADLQAAAGFIQEKI